MQAHSSLSDALANNSLTLTEMEQRVIQAIERCVRWLVPFAAWRMPDSDQVSFVAAPSLISGSAPSPQADAFFICPFARPIAEACRIPFEIGADEVLDMQMPSRDLPSILSESTDKADYTARLSDLVVRLKARGHAKTVISTVMTVETPAPDPASHIAATANRLFANGKGLFCNCWYHPRLGLWMGATPELLISLRSHGLRSIALAGTTPIGSEWDEKNRAEHQFVVDYIAGALALEGISPFISSTYDVQFGQLKHLRTDFDAFLPDNVDLAALIDALNPTPALCGYPKEQALSDIDAIETHRRQCYGGLVGVARGTDIDAFVNIRCAQFGPGQCKYYSGGGITADSVPEAEWAEAQAKRQQLINFFNQDN